MTLRRLLVALGALALFGLGVLAWRGSSTPPARPALPPLSPRGDLVRGVEVFSPGGQRPGALVDLCEGTHLATARLLGRPVTSPAGLRVHVFPSKAACRAYTKLATGANRPGAAYIFRDGARLVVLHPESDLGLLQHEVGHDAIQISLGAISRWFSEGLAAHLESWKASGARLSRRPCVVWATRCVAAAEANTLPSQASVESDAAFEVERVTPLYARSWASVEALIVLRGGEGPGLRPDHGLNPAALDALGGVLAEHWARPKERVDLFLAQAAAEGDPRRREALLSLAEHTVGRLSPERDPVEGHKVLARALADGSSDLGRRLRAAATLCERRAEPEDWLRLVRAATACLAPRTARWARARGLRRHPDAQELKDVALPAAPPAPERLTLAEGELRVELASADWDRGELEVLGRRVLAAALFLAEFNPDGPRAWRLSVGLPGGDPEEEAGRLLVEGWPREPLMLRDLADTLRLKGALGGLKLEPWRRVGVQRALAGLLDPSVEGWTRGWARAVLSGPHRVRDPLGSLGVKDPGLAALASLSVRAAPRGPLLVALPEDAALPAARLLAGDPGDPRALALAKETLEGPPLRFALLAALYAGGDARAALAADLEASSPLAAKALRAR